MLITLSSLRALSLAMSLVGLFAEQGLELLRSRKLDLAEPAYHTRTEPQFRKNRSRWFPGQRPSLVRDNHTTTAVAVLTSTLTILVEQVGTFVQGLIDLGDDTADGSVNVRGGLDGLNGTDSV